MKRANVFHLASGTLTLQRWEDGDLREAIAVESTREGVASLAAELGAAARGPALLLVDVAEEEFVMESVPRLLGRERQQLLRRRAERLFPGNASRATQPLRRKRSEKGLERVLFSALTRPDAIAPCLDALMDQGIPLCAVSSIPHVAAALPHALGIHEPFMLLATEQADGLRLSYFREGELCASRLSPVSVGRQTVIEEFARTRRYLEHSGLMPGDGVLVVYCLCAPPSVETLEAVSLPEGFELRVGTLAEAAAHLGLSYCEAAGAPSLFAGLLVRSPVNRYAEPRHLRGFRSYRAARVADLVGLVAALVLCTIGLAGADRALEMGYAADAPRSVTPMAASASLPDGLTAGPLRAAVELAEQQLHDAMAPDAALKAVGAILKDHPDIELQRIEWAGYPDQRLADLPPEEAKTFGLTGTRASALSAPWQGLFVEAGISPGNGGLRQTSSEVTALMRELESNPRVRGVELASAPVDPEGLLRGSAGREAPPAASLPFSLRVVLTP